MNEAKPSIFPVTVRSKLPKGYSYPIGAQASSEALADIPQRDGVEIRFYGHQYDRKQLQEIRRNKTLQPVLIASYAYAHVPSTAQSRRNPFGGAFWRIDVQPVLSTNRHVARTQLLEHALPRVRTWFMTERTETWLDSSHRIMCEFDPVEQVIRVLEKDE